MPHKPVLLDEVLEFFAGRPLHTFVDGTLGAGGHAEAVLQAHPEIEQYIGIDQDPEARQIAQKRLQAFAGRLIIVDGNFQHLEEHLDLLQVEAVDGMLFDLGMSSMQLDVAERGFSFARSGPLDMRMDPKTSLSAQEVVNTWSEKDLGAIFRDYGEERKWRAAARAIVAARKKRSIETTDELKQVLASVLFRRYKERTRTDPMTKVFQALRICVNSELEVLRTVLPQALKWLRVGGRLGVISFHSLEDRIVKNFFREAASDKVSTSGIGGVFLDKEPEVILLTKKPVVACKREQEENPRSRSAKLRVIEKR